jgi:hypothetical protein
LREDVDTGLSPPAAKQDLPEVEADPLGLEGVTRDVRRAGDMELVFESLEGRERFMLRLSRSSRAECATCRRNCSPAPTEVIE